MKKEIHWIHDLDDFVMMVMESRKLIAQLFKLEESGKSMSPEYIQETKEFLMERVKVVAPYLMVPYYIKEKP